MKIINSLAYFFLTFSSLLTIGGCARNPVEEQVSSTEQQPAVILEEEGQSNPISALFSKGIDSAKASLFALLHGDRNDGGNGDIGGGSGATTLQTHLQFKTVCGFPARSYANELRDAELRIYYQRDKGAPVEQLYVQAIDPNQLHRGLAIDIPIDLPKLFAQYNRPQSNVMITFCEPNAAVPQDLFTSNVINQKLPGCTTVFGPPSKVAQFCELDANNPGNSLNVINQPAILVPFFYKHLDTWVSPRESTTECDAISESPLVLDLNSDDKITTVSINKGMLFDLNADGISEQTSWLAAQKDGFLALPQIRTTHDAKGNTIKIEEITSGRELFGDATLLPDGTIASDGFQALAQYDSNHDHTIDGWDRDSNGNSIFNRLRVAKVTSQRGFKIEPLSKYAKSLSLRISGMAAKVDEQGNQLRQRSHYVDRKGKKRALIDIWFLTAPQITTSTNDICPVIPTR